MSTKDPRLGAAANTCGGETSGAKYFRIHNCFHVGILFAWICLYVTVWWRTLFVTIFVWAQEPRGLAYTRVRKKGGYAKSIRKSTRVRKIVTSGNNTANLFFRSEESAFPLKKTPFWS